MNLLTTAIKTRESRNAREKSRLVINLDFQPLLEQAGLVSFADFFLYAGGELIKRIPDRTVTRISLGQESFFLKRHLLEIHSLWQRSSASEGAAEFDNYCLFRDHGLATALPVAMGEREIEGVGTESFLLTRDFAPLISLEYIIRHSPQLLAGPENMEQRLRILATTADYARRMHRSGLNHLDYNATHILIHGLDNEDHELMIAVFDLQRISKNRLSSWRWPIKTLAELNYTLPAELVSDEERLFMLKRYLGREKLAVPDRLLWQAIRAKTEKIDRHTIKRRARRRLLERERADTHKAGPRQMLIRDRERAAVEPVTVETLLREVLGSREVWAGLWREQPVIVKVFQSKQRGERQLLRERQGLLTLQQRGIPAPVPLLHGEDAMGRPVLVMERIKGAVSGAELIAGHSSGPEGSQTPYLLSLALAHLNQKGVEQKDLHAGNFLFQGEEVFTIDPAEMRFVRSPLGLRRSLAQLAQLGALFPELRPEEFTDLASIYAQTRRWHLNESTMARLVVERQKIIVSKLNKRLKKYGRKNTRHEEIIGRNYRLLIDRQSHWSCRETEELAAVLRQAFICRDGSPAGQPVAFTWEDRQLAAYRVPEATGISRLLKAVFPNYRKTPGWWQDLYRKQGAKSGEETPVALLQPRSPWLGLSSFIVIDTVLNRFARN